MLFKLAFTIPFVILCIWVAAHMGIAGPFLIVFMAVVLSYMWTPHLAEMMSNPLTNIIDGGIEEPEPKPYYSIAISKRKMNKPLEAIVAIREQLAKFPNDFEGVSLLASIQAEDMKDLQSAEITFDHFCNCRTRRRDRSPPRGRRWQTGI